MIEETKLPSSPEAARTRATSKYEDNALYQEDRLVARIVDPEINREGKEIHFREVYNSDELVLPDECIFQKYRLMIQRIADASRIDKNFPEKGRVLKGVVAEILGYREQ